jgi:hypothetical protein
LQTLYSDMNHDMQLNETQIAAQLSEIAAGGLDLKSSRPTLPPLTLPAGKEEWIACMRVYLARSGLLQGEAGAKPLTDGRTLCGSSESAGQLSFFWSASQTSSGSTNESEKTLTASATASPPRSFWTLPQWVRRTLGPDIGLLATPTTKANQCCKSMQKWPCCRRLTLALGGKLTPARQEWMMGWPIGHTAIGRQETDNHQSRPRLLG